MCAHEQETNIISESEKKCNPINTTHSDIIKKKCNPLNTTHRDIIYMYKSYPIHS